ncbi:MAG: CvpA family protein [Oscillospiraceae bacterium]|nr:CvpA family protein [Oscillospiraceae bacterium]
MVMALNLAVLLVLAFCVWQGYRKGLILSVCSVVIVIISAYASGQIASHYAESAAARLAPVLNWLPDKQISEAIDEVARGMGPIGEITDKAVLREIADIAFDKIGIIGAYGDILSGKTMASLTSGITIRQAIETQFLYGIAHLILCIFSFLVIFIVLTLLMHFLGALFKLPVLGLADKIGGSLLGLVTGVLILCVVGWIMQFIGVFLPPELALSGLLRYFMELELLNGLLNF